MADNDDLPIKVDVGLKAELKGEIPTEKVGKAVDAILDALSPFTQGMGLVGDHLRFHREKVIIKIGGLAKQKAKSEGFEIKPVPPKFMIPFIEKGSCEDLESDLIRVWASLLKEAGRGDVQNLIPFVNILAEMTSKEAHGFVVFMEPYLKAMKGYSPDLKDFFTENSFFITGPIAELPWKNLQPLILDLVSQREETTISKKIDAIQDFILKNVNSPKVYSFRFESRDADQFYFYLKPEERNTLEILCHLNLVEFLPVYPPSIISHVPGATEFKIVLPTAFGFRFFVTCMRDF